MDFELNLVLMNILKAIKKFNCNLYQWSISNLYRAQNNVFSKKLHIHSKKVYGIHDQISLKYITFT
jgi:hypothetical protein